MIIFMKRKTITFLSKCNQMHHTVDTEYLIELYCINLLDKSAVCVSVALVTNKYLFLHACRYKT